MGRPTTAALLGAFVLVGMPTALAPSAAIASSKQVSILEDDDQIQANPAGTLERFRLLGADVVRVAMQWELIAPNPNGTHPPRGFDGSDPAAYPAAKWKVWDEIVTDARGRDHGRPRPDGRSPAVGARAGAPGGQQQPELGAVRRRFRGVRTGGRHQVRRRLLPALGHARARRRRRPAARRLLVDLERAELRAEPRTAGRSRGSADREQPKAEPAGCSTRPGARSWPPGTPRRATP